MMTVVPTVYQVEMDDGSTRGLTAPQIKELVDRGLDDEGEGPFCPVCFRDCDPRGWVTHSKMHLRAIGLEPPVPKGYTKSKKKKPKAQPDLTEACLALLSAYVDSIPISMVNEVNIWVAATHRLVKELK